MKKLILLVLLLVCPLAYAGTDLNIERVANAARDTTTGSLTAIDHAHHEIHDGYHFTIASYDTIGANETIVFGVTVPDTTKWAHLFYEVQSTAITTAVLMEGATFTSGTSITPPNNNRNSSETSGLTIVRTPTVTAEGTRISSSKWGTATTPSRPPTGGSVGRESEIILKQNTKYLIKISSDSAGNVISYRADWYEHRNL